MSTALDICAQKRVVLRLPSVRGNNPSIDIEMLESFLKYSGRDIDEKFRHFTHFQPPSSSHFLVIFDMDYQQNPNPNLNEMSHEVYNIKFDNNEPEFIPMGDKALDLAKKFTHMYRWGC
ncbi:hypothetical protein MMC24_005778 [Lignoscripta atroalba]|nr:hypothetical protein [Lignoscripta atroalba]